MLIYVLLHYKIIQAGTKLRDLHLQLHSYAIEENLILEIPDKNRFNNSELIALLRRLQPCTLYAYTGR